MALPISIFSVDFILWDATRVFLLLCCIKWVDFLQPFNDSAHSFFIILHLGPCNICVFRYTCLVQIPDECMRSGSASGSNTCEKIHSGSVLCLDLLRIWPLAWMWFQSWPDNSRFLKKFVETVEPPPMHKYGDWWYMAPPQCKVEGLFHLEGHHYLGFVKSFGRQHLNSNSPIHQKPLSKGKVPW